jgi:hypothetical protein
MNSSHTAGQILDNVTVSSLAIDLMTSLDLPADFRRAMLKRKVYINASRIIPLINDFV